MTVAKVERAYGRAAVLMPNIGALRHDKEKRAWFIGQKEIGKTTRDAERYLAGVVDGLIYQAFSVGIENGRARQRSA